MNAKGSKKKRKATKSPARSVVGRAGIGSSFDSFLRDEGVFEETRAIAIKRVTS